jgi:hypothetical protein
MTTTSASSNTPVVVHYELTRAELRAAVLSSTFRNPRLYILPGAGVLFLLWGLAQRFGSGPYPTIGDLPIFFGLIDLMILPLVALVVLVRVPGLHARTGRQDFAFSPRGVQIRSQRAESNVAWSAYRSSAEGGRFFVLRPVNSRARVFIPKRAFASPEDLPRFRQLLALHAAGQLR